MSGLLVHVKTFDPVSVCVPVYIPAQSSADLCGAPANPFPEWLLPGREITQRATEGT